VQELLGLALHHLGDRDPGPLRHDGGDVLVGHLLAQVALLRLDLRERLAQLLDLLLHLGDLAVGDLRHLPELPTPLSVLGLAPQHLDRGLDLADLVDDLLLALPLGPHRARALLELGDLTLHVLQACLARRVALLLERLLLDLQLHQLALHGVDLRRHAVHFHLDLGRCLVDEIDRLVGQEPIGHVPVAERRRSHERGVLDPDPVMDLVPLLEAAQDRNRVLHGRLGHHYRLEPPLERGVLLDALAVLVQRRRADAPQLAACQGRLEQVRRVHGALGCSGTHDRVKLVDEEDDLSLRRLDLLQNGLEPVLELAPELGSGHERPHVERAEPLVLQRLGHVSPDDALGDPFHDGGLADARLPDEHGVVLGSPRQDLHHAADLLVSPDDRIGLALPGGVRQVPRVLLERLELHLRILVGDPLASADTGERRQELLVAHAAVLLEQGHDLAIVARHREHVVLDRDVVVLQLLGLVVRATDDLERPARHSRLGPTGDVRVGRQALGHGCPERRDVDPRLLQYRSRDAALLIQHCREQVLGLKLRVAAARGAADGFLESFSALRRHPVRAHGPSPRRWLTPRPRRPARSRSASSLSLPGRS
jgi:hypothetical protein